MEAAKREAAQAASEVESREAAIRADAEARAESREAVARVEAEAQAAAALDEAEAQVTAARADAESRVAAATADAESREAAMRADLEAQVKAVREQVEAGAAAARAEFEAQASAARKELEETKAGWATLEATNRTLETEKAERDQTIESARVEAGRAPRRAGGSAVATDRDGGAGFRPRAPPRRGIGSDHGVAGGARRGQRAGRTGGGQGHRAR